MRRYGYQLLAEFVVTFPSDPTVNSDLEHAYGVGQFWINTETGDCWQCTDDTTGAAVWSNLSAGGGGGGGTPSGTVAVITGTAVPGSAMAYSRGDHAHALAANSVALTNLATQANNTLLGNVSGIAASPIALTSSQVSTLLGLGSAAFEAMSAFDTAGSAAAVLASSLQKASNLSDLASAPTARTNLGLGTAATQATSFFLQAANNLSDLASASTARTNLGLGSAATQASSAFDAAGAANTAVTNLLASSNTWTNANAFNTTLSSVGACTFDTNAIGSSFGGPLTIGGEVNLAATTGGQIICWGPLSTGQITINNVGGIIPNGGAIAGFGTPVGAAVVNNFNASTATTLQTNQVVAQIIAALINLGPFGA